ncbi:putative membrane protein [Microvirga flocculans]|uniref:Putative membrane protein n=1 Tax=Microvirga flocculans TaxID=217168 RepID=A0A7W6IEI1_9HYPH|nr:hypothetical protein [Microvirga flocculans]MBB4039998.1 putative membrane protein [Microvirga flocculans]
MRMTYIVHAARTGRNQPWNTLLRLVAALAAALVLLVAAFIGLVVVLPLLFIGGIALHFYIRRKLRQAQSKADDGVIDAEYTVIERRE